MKRLERRPQSLVVPLLACWVTVLATGCFHAKAPTAMAPTIASTPILSQGETLMTTTSGDVGITVKIRTHAVDIAAPGSDRPAAIDSNCTNSRSPCSVVDGLDITVNGTPLIVPRSVFCDLADVKTAEISPGEGGWIMTVLGGEAAESYVEKIYFNASHVRGRTFASTMWPDQPLEETTYRVKGFQK